MLYLQLSLFRQNNILILDPVKGMVDNMQHVFGVAAYLLTGMLLLQFYAVKRLLHPIAAIGQMWLSNYLFQTATGILLFYNVAFKLYPETGPLTNAVFAISIFILQVIASNIWRYYFYHGPLEWLWRSAAAYRWRRFYKGKRDRN
jgi:uncharacterized protein